MPIIIEIDLENALDALDSVGTFFKHSDQVAEIAGFSAADLLVSRTLSGKDVNDVPFAKYSEEYARRHGSHVDLHVTGQMLGSITPRPSKNSVEIVCESDVAQYHEQGTSKMPQRQFMGLSLTDREKLMEEAFMEPIDDLLQPFTG